MTKLKTLARKCKRKLVNSAKQASSPSIAIKSLSDQDRADFEEFLKTNREPLPKLALSPLAPPHESIAVFSLKDNSAASCKAEKLNDFAKMQGLLFCQPSEGTCALSLTKPYEHNGVCSLFSGYLFRDGEMLIGQQEAFGRIPDSGSIDEDYGEWCLCSVSEQGVITLSSDFFGMVPWFYYEDSSVFAASNSYHLLLLALRQLGVRLNMDIPRSRVNMITSGFTYGSPFSMNLDVAGCKMTLAYERIVFSRADGFASFRTTLWDIVSEPEPWDEDKYEEYLDEARSELFAACKAAFEHPRFNRIVVDVSGGFDSRTVFATANNLPKRLRKKLHTFTRKSGTTDDVEKASALINLYDYPKHTYVKTDTSDLYTEDGSIRLSQNSRTLGLFSHCSYLYSSCYNDHTTLEITGYLGEVILGYRRCRGDSAYELGDRRLLARLGGCYLHNSVKDLQEVFEDQERIIMDTLANYSSCDCLFKKFQLLYLDGRNRFICGSSHNIENDNMRIPMLNSKYALKAKWMYFNRFTNNEVPDEKISVDLINKINPLLAAYPFAKENDNDIPQSSNLLVPIKAVVEPDQTFKPGPSLKDAENLYRDKVIDFIDNLDVAEQMLLHIFDYSSDYYPVCLGTHKVLTEMRKSPNPHRSSREREAIRKIYDIYFQIQAIS